MSWPRLAPGHPCFFAQRHLGDAFVSIGVDKWNMLDKQRAVLLVEGNQMEAALLLDEMKRLADELRTYCESKAGRSQ